MQLRRRLVRASLRPGAPVVRSDEWRWARAPTVAALALPSRKPGGPDKARTCPTGAEAEAELSY